jgi:hypothetical protein
MPFHLPLPRRHHPFSHYFCRFQGSHAYKLIEMWGRYFEMEIHSVEQWTTDF